MFSTKTDLFKVPLLVATSTDSFQSFAFHVFLMSPFATSVTGPWGQWNFPAFSTQFRLCSMASTAPVTTSRRCGMLRLLSLLIPSRFTILYVVYLACFLHSIQMILYGNFQFCYFHDSSQADIFAFLDNLAPYLVTGNSTNDSVCPLELFP